jgi:hypothetical protein
VNVACPLWLLDDVINVTIVTLAVQLHRLFGTVRVAMEAILGVDDSKALKNYSIIFEKLLRLRQGNSSRFAEVVLLQYS